MACACVVANKIKCQWCLEAERLGYPPSRHSCQWGSCS